MDELASGLWQFYEALNLHTKFTRRERFALAKVYVEVLLTSVADAQDDQPGT